MRSLEDMIVTQVYTEAGDNSPGPGPMALVQFRVWETRPGEADLAAPHRDQTELVGCDARVQDDLRAHGRG